MADKANRFMVAMRWLESAFQFYFSGFREAFRKAGKTALTVSGAITILVPTVLWLFRIGLTFGQERLINSLYIQIPFLFFVVFFAIMLFYVPFAKYEKVCSERDNANTLVGDYAKELSEANFKLGQLDWFRNEVDADCKEIGEGIYAFDWRIEQDYEMPSPSVTIKFDVFNGSLFKVFIGQEISGFISYRTSSKKALNLELPVLMSEKWRQWETGLPRHKREQISITQRLTKDEAEFIKNDPNSRIGMFVLEHLQLMVTTGSQSTSTINPAVRPLKFFCEGIRRNGTLG